MNDEEPSEDPVIDPAVTRDLFLEWRSPRFGRANPEGMNNPFWESMIKTRMEGFLANERMEGLDSLEAGPVWCFKRFGQSSTLLRDGREVWIGGEHEDYYDPDFYIYNDVVVCHSDGQLDIYGYPKEVFPPTDFHSATLVGDKIVMIGSLGYPEERKPGVTQVLTLDTQTWTVCRREPEGDSPGWISNHKAELVDGGRAIVVVGGQVARESNELVENIDDWKLDLTGWRWKRLTERRWTRWIVRRKDGRLNSLWRVHSVITLSGIPSMRDLFEKEMQALIKDYGREPDLELAQKIYRPAVAHEPLPEEADSYDVHRIRVNGVTVRYVEESDRVTVTVEGELPPAVLEELVRDIAEKLRKIENHEYEVEPI